jgi:hypothetical protein
MRRLHVFDAIVVLCWGSRGVRSPRKHSSCMGTSQSLKLLALAARHKKRAANILNKALPAKRAAGHKLSAATKRERHALCCKR